MKGRIRTRSVRAILGSTLSEGEFNISSAEFQNTSFGEGLCEAPPKRSAGGLTNPEGWRQRQNAWKPFADPGWRRWMSCASPCWGRHLQESCDPWCAHQGIIFDTVQVRFGSTVLNGNPVLNHTDAAPAGPAQCKGNKGSRWEKA
jgi:hypothetical protein